MEYLAVIARDKLDMMQSGETIYRLDRTEKDGAKK
jgi:cell division protein FtsB